jgi:hypothetical protein
MNLNVIAATPAPKNSASIVIRPGDVSADEDHDHQRRAIASGAMTPLAPGITVYPMVRTRKKVPMNSVKYLFIRMD